MKIQFIDLVAKYGFRCLRCGNVVFNKEKNRLIGTYEKRNMFDTATVLCCARCGNGVGVLIEEDKKA